MRGTGSGPKQKLHASLRYSTTPLTAWSAMTAECAYRRDPKPADASLTALCDSDTSCNVRVAGVSDGHELRHMRCSVTSQRCKFQSLDLACLAAT
ncbi:hypothetical protein XHV734_0728 [Xanthomonas hortorum pv. vitians]|nr:hypothetical protein XHV734_0728 [Xanthomonas hortorum pv. vitians]